MPLSERNWIVFKDKFEKAAREYYHFFMVDIRKANAAARRMNMLETAARAQDEKKYKAALTDISNSSNDEASLSAAISLYALDKDAALRVGLRHAKGDSTVKNAANRWLENVERGFFTR